MRRTYISPEYISTKLYGTFNMVEESNFFSAKMLDIEDSLYLRDQDLIYYQNANGEQTDFSIESSLTPQVYSTIDSKKSNHTLLLDETQSQFQKDTNTKWVMTIDLETILSDYIFSSMKKFRSFEGLKNKMTRAGDVNVALRQYVAANVTNRYKFSKIELYISYKDLRNQSILRYKTYWNHVIQKEENKVVKFQTETAFDQSSVKLFFSQEKNSTQYSFEYYYNILFEKL
jgi:hypothetical protein